MVAKRLLFLVLIAAIGNSSCIGNSISVTEQGDAGLESDQVFELRTYTAADGKFDDGGAMEPGNPGWHTTDTLDFRYRILAGVECGCLGPTSLAEVDAAGQLADDDEIHTGKPLGAQWRRGDQFRIGLNRP